MRAADRVRLAVPLERIPTVYPLRDARRGKPVSGTFRGLLKRMRAALRTQALLDSDYPPCHEQDDFLHPKVNPATGLLMIGSVDAAGNPYGFDLHAARQPFDSAQVVTHHEHDESSDDLYRRHPQTQFGLEDVCSSFPAGPTAE
jgi:hypothetical protein